MPTVEALTEHEELFLERIQQAKKVADEAALARAEWSSTFEYPRGATTGPLSTLIPILFDIESTMTSEISLSKMTLRQYAAVADIESFSIAIGDDEPKEYFHPQLPGLPDHLPRITPEIIRALQELAKNPAYVWVAHNMPFDIRMARFKWGIQHPQNTWCTLEGAMCAWPELPGGYSLDNCSLRLGLPRNSRKFKLQLKLLNKLRNDIFETGAVPVVSLDEDFAKEIKRILKLGGIPVPTHIDLPMLYDVLSIYNRQDVVAMREIYLREIARINEQEQRVGLRTFWQRSHILEVDGDKLEHFIASMDDNARYAERQAAEYLSDEQAADIFNRETEDGSLRSIRYQRLRRIINEVREGEAEFDSTSAKKINPIQLAANPTPAAILEHTGSAGKMISHRRKAAQFHGVDVVDVELGPWRAHTFRFSSPSTGRGLNLHNIPKHQKEIAKPLRSTFHLPDHLCFVRGDFANIEYRIEGMLTNCQTVLDMFVEERGGNVFNDPYCLSWKAMTGVAINKKDHPIIRQVAKSATLGLGFCMSPIGYARVILVEVSRGSVTEKGLQDIIEENGWGRPPGKALDRIKSMLGCSDTIATAAYHIHRAFNAAHPEFKLTADWLVSVVNVVASCGTGATLTGSRTAALAEANRRVDQMYFASAAPDRNMLDVIVEDDGISQYFNVRVRCGPWTETVCWREPYPRITDFNGSADKKQLTVRKSTGLWKPFTRQLAIENVTQSAARNALCMGIERLEQQGWRDVIHIHDEILLVVPRQREAVLKAREALNYNFGPNHDLPYKWAVLIKPNEVAVTSSLWEDEDDIATPYFNKKTGAMCGNDRWGMIERNDPGCLVNLP